MFHAEARAFDGLADCARPVLAGLFTQPTEYRAHNSRALIDERCIKLDKIGTGHQFLPGVFGIANTPHTNNRDASL